MDWGPKSCCRQLNVSPHGRVFPCRSQVLWVCISLESPWSSTVAQRAAAKQPFWITLKHCGWGVLQHGRYHTHIILCPAAELFHAFQSVCIPLSQTKISYAASLCLFQAGWRFNRATQWNLQLTYRGYVSLLFSFFTCNDSTVTILSHVFIEKLLCCVLLQCLNFCQWFLVVSWLYSGKSHPFTAPCFLISQ